MFRWYMRVPLNSASTASGASFLMGDSCIPRALPLNLGSLIFRFLSSMQQFLNIWCDQYITTWIFRVLCIKLICLNNDNMPTGEIMVLRLVELSIAGTPEESMQRFMEAALLEPLPDLVFFPELFTTGYVLDDIPRLALQEDELKNLPPADAARENGLWFVAGTYPVSTDRGVVNKMVVYSPGGELTYTTDKVHLFKQMGEDRAFAPGSCGGVFDLNGTAAAGIVCYDLRFPELARRLTLAGAEILFVPAQWPSGRIKLFRSLLRARAAEAQVFVAGCNLGGEHLGVLFKGGGGVAHPGGKMLKGENVVENVIDYDLDLSHVAEMRTHLNCLEDRRPEEY
ncbi:MAG: hypothetical protein GF388_05375 [Candidatus Aegiribacteria sp.]|nr:hypothetical protein [Candidatus Aegiribacteria sp.]MBD3294637.1 hypothetical protein [Candidatus Fermentibacteria bacterium]